MTFVEVQRYPSDWGVMGKFNSPEEKQEEINRMLYEQSQRGSHYPSSSNNFPVPLPPIPTADDPYVLEDHPMNTAEDDYEIYVDHEDGQRIKSRPKVKKEEILICPDGNPCPEPDTMSFLDSFLNEDVAGVPYTLPDQQIFYETGGKVHQMPKPIKEDYDMERLIQSMRDRYRV